MEVLYKDSSKVNHKGSQPKLLKEVLKEIAGKLKEAEKKKDRRSFLKGWLYGSSQPGPEQNPKHNGCEGFIDKDKPDEEKGKLEEPRICKCMYYYGKNNPSNCEKCKLRKKWRNIGSISVTEHEIPIKYKYSKIGAMDLILDDEYAVEVKPPRSNENLGRMFAEILTYTTEPAYNGKYYKPGICMFNSKKTNGEPDNEPMYQYRKLINEGNKDLEYIARHIKIFYVEGNFNDEIVDFEIKPIEMLEV